MLDTLPGFVPLFAPTPQVRPQFRPGSERFRAFAFLDPVKLPTLKPRLAELPARLQAKPVERIRGRRLQRIRAEHFQRNPLCVRCQEKGIVTLATELDHVIPLHKGGQDVEANRQGLCDDCHLEKTREDLATP